MLGQESNQHGFARSRRARSDLSAPAKRAQRAQRAQRAGIIALCLGLASAAFLSAARAFLSAQPYRGKRVSRFATDPKSRPASLLYEEEEAYDDEEIDDDNFDEITMDDIDSLASLDDDDEDFSPKRPIKADVHPKFKRAGYFERQDLNRLDVSEFDRQGKLQRLSIDDLERRLEKRFGVSDRAKKPLPREPLTDEDDHDLFWKPGRRELRPARPSQPLRPARPAAEARPMAQLAAIPMQLKETQQNVKGRPHSVDLSS